MLPQPIRGTRAAPPRRSRTAVVIPIAVAGLTLALLVWSAWPSLRPVRTVAVVQALPVPTAADAVMNPGPGPGTETPPGRDHGVATHTVQAPGWLEAEPFYVAAPALADGIVATVDVLEGEHVTRGQVVATLVARDSQLRVAHAEAGVASAAAAVAAAEADLRAATTAWEQPFELERAVASGGAALAEARAELAQLPMLIASAEADRVRLEAELDSARRSRAGNAATELEVVTAQQNLEAQRAMVESLRAREPLLTARVDRLESDLRAAERELELRIEDRRRLDAARAALDGARAALESAEVARDQARLELERMTIRAPIDGYVQARLKVPGDKAMRGMDNPASAQIVHLYDPSRLQVRVDVPLADAAHVYAGQPCEVIVEVLPDRVFKGEVLRSTHLADLQKNTLEMKVRVIDPDPMLRPDMLTRVKFLPGDGPASPRADAPGPGPGGGKAPLLVPPDALHAGVLWTVTDRRADRGRARPVPAARLGEHDGYIAVSADLAPGALLIVGPGVPSAGELVRISARPGELLPDHSTHEETPL